MTDVLILNADANPLSVLPLSTEDWQTIVKKVWEETVTVVHNYPDWCVRSPSVELQVPSVVMLRDYIRVAKTVKFNKGNVFLRDNYTCQYCSVNFEEDRHLLTYEHVIPRKYGGKTNWDNIITSCSKCNHERGSILNYRKPNTMPHKPDYWKLSAKQKKRPIIIPDEQWLPYLDWEGEVTINQRKAA